MNSKCSVGPAILLWALSLAIGPATALQAQTEALASEGLLRITRPKQQLGDFVATYKIRYEHTGIVPGAARRQRVVEYGTYQAIRKGTETALFFNLEHSVPAADGSGAASVTSSVGLFFELDELVCRLADGQATMLPRHTAAPPALAPFDTDLGYAWCNEGLIAPEDIASSPRFQGFEAVASEHGEGLTYYIGPARTFGDSTMRIVWNRIEPGERAGTETLLSGYHFTFPNGSEQFLATRVAQLTRRDDGYVASATIVEYQKPELSDSAPVEPQVLRAVEELDSRLRSRVDLDLVAMRNAKAEDRTSIKDYEAYVAAVALGDEDTSPQPAVAVNQATGEEVRVLTYDKGARAWGPGPTAP